MTDYIPDGLSDFANALANPIKYQSELEKRSKQLSILTGELEDPLEVIFIQIPTMSITTCQARLLIVFLRFKLLLLQYEVDSKLTSDKDAEDKDVDTKVRAHQQPSVEGDMPVSTVTDNIPTSIWMMFLTCQLISFLSYLLLFLLLI